jgi:hypothetical protein
VNAQVPGAAAAPTGGGTAAGTNGGATAATAAAADAKPGFFMKACAALEECKRKLCKTAAGQLLNSMTAPISTMTGGVIPSFCPVMPSAKDLLKEGTEGAAANAKKDALEAKERVKAVRYLGTLDCRYYPEAELALIAALRMDRVECVRWEAAMAFGHGCCCTKKVIEALEISVSGSERDGNPSERSPRVRDAAAFALDHCLACYREPLREIDDKDREGKDPPRIKDGETLPDPRPNKVNRDREMIERARQTVAIYGSRRESLPPTMVAQQTVLPKGQRSLYHIIRFGADGPSQPVTQQVARQTPQSATVFVSQSTAPPRELPTVETVPARSTPIGDRRDNTSMKPAVERNDSAQPPAPIARTPQAELKQHDGQPSQPQESAPIVIFAPPEKPAASVVTAEPMEPAPSSVLKQHPAEEVEKPSALRPLNLQPTLQVAPATVEKPVADDRTIVALIENMLTGTTAEDRHQAIRAIVVHDWRKNPQIVAALVKTARLDSDRAVRVNAIRHLAHLKIDVPYVVDHLKYMEKDQDTWVQEESTAAIEKLAAK